MRCNISQEIIKQHQAIAQEYRRQAPRWGKLDISEHLRWVVDQLPLSPQCEVADVAAGTGLFGRAVAAHVASVAAVDITPEMIAQGRARAERDGIANMEWRQGAAEALPFPDERFDLVITRYSVHHFVDPVAVFVEMARVCRRNGTIAVVDMVSDEHPAVAARHDMLETLIDGTHTHILPPSQLFAAATKAGLTVQAYLSRDVPMNFEQWQAHVPQDAEARLSVRRALEAELAGGEQTGMRPLLRDGALCFTHVWGLLMAGKRHRGLIQG
jgi:ubiquinone/menaquinone biosynthesis C-methylase UbiE